MKQRLFLYSFALSVVLLSLVACPSPERISNYPWDADPSAGFMENPDATTQDVYFGNVRAINPDADNSLSTDSTESEWYKLAIFYHIWVPSFADSNGDGIGDIQGIIDHLDYLSNDLGVTAIWLSPVFESASNITNLHGYDTTNHFRVDPRLGSNYRLQELIREVHRRGLRIIFDYVPNHVSNLHPWFVGSAKDTSNKYRNWFIWKSPRPSGWTGWDASSDFHGPVDGYYYYGLFWEGMPDLNYEEQAVRQAMVNVLLGWLNFGFDGIRVDAVKYLFEDWSSSGSGYVDQQKTLEHWQQVRTLLDKYHEQSYAKFMVAENWTSAKDNLVQYMNQNTTAGFHMTLDFPFAYAAANLNTTAIDNHWQYVQSTVIPAGGWMGTFTSNHDNVVSRPMTTFNGDVGKVRLQAALQLTGLGTPYIYYGNEIGMTGQAGDDRNLRRPFSWNTIMQQKSDPASLLSWNKALNVLRKSRPSLSKGEYIPLINDNGMFAFERTLDSERTLVVMNSSASEADLTVPLHTVPSAVRTLFGTDNTTWSSGTTTITLNKIAGFGVRVLALEAGAPVQTLINDIPYTVPLPPAIYLMGSLSDWTNGAKMNALPADPVVLQVSRNLSANTGYTFKFKVGSSWYGYTEIGTKYDTTLAEKVNGTSVSATEILDDGTEYHNITFTPVSSGSYSFLYRSADNHWCIVQH